MRVQISVSIACLAAAAVSASAQDLNKCVTFKHPLASARKVLDAFGQSAGLTLKTIPQTGDEPLFLDVKGLSVKTVLDEVAQTLGAEWEGSGSTMTLVRGSKLLKAQEAKFAQFRAEQIKKAIDDYSKDLTKRPKLTDNEIRSAVDRERAAREAMMRDFRERSAGGGAVPIRAPEVSLGPAQRALARLLLNVDPTWVASLKRGTRTVMATRNNAMQRPMPSNTPQALDQFITEYNTWVDTTGEKPTGGNAGASFAIRIGDTGPEPSERRATAQRINQVGKAHLIFSRQSGNTSVDLVLFDAEGKQIGFAFASLLSDNIAQEPVDPKYADTPFKPEADTLSFAKAITGSAASTRATFTPSGNSTVSIVTGIALSGPGGASNEATLEGDLRQRVAAVDQNDPLSWLYNPIFGWVGSELKRSVIASVPDTALLPIAQRMTGPGLTLNGFFTSARSLGIEYSDSNGVLRIQPQFHTWARESRINRQQLGKLLGTLLRNGMLGLDDFATYALAYGSSPIRPGLDDAILGSLDREAQSEYRFQVMPNWRLMRLYATFNPQQRQRLAANEPLPFQLLSEHQVALLNDMAFNDLRGPSVRMRESVETAPMIMAFGGSGNAAGTVLQERTEALPTGVTRAGGIRVNLQRDAGIFAGSSKKPGWRFFSLPEYGGHVAMTSSGNMPAGIEQKEYDRFRTGRREQYGFDFAFAESVSMSANLNDEVVDSGFIAGPFANLPIAVREEIARNVELAKEQTRRLPTGAPLPPPPGT